MKRGFTLIELLVVLAILAILATGIVVTINPGERFAQMRDMRRRENLERIYSAIQNKLLSEGGSWQDCSEIPFEPTPIGKSYYDLYSCLVPRYLSQELYDPKEGNSENSGYEIWRTGLGEIGLRAQGEKPRQYIIVGALPNLPIVTTLQPKNITDVSAETGGKVHFQGDSEVIERGVVYDTMSRPTIQDNKVKAGAGVGEFEVLLENLEPETKYYVRAYAINSSGVAYGPEYSFVTQVPTFPRVRTEDASNIKPHSATLNGRVLSLGNFSSVQVYFQYRKKGESGWPQKTPKITLGQTGPFSQTITGLEEKTTYEFAFVGEYQGGKSEGKILEFTTLSKDPVVETLKAENVKWNSAILTGRLVSLGIYQKVNVYFLYKKTSETVWLITSFQEKTSPSDFQALITGLSPETEYEFKAVASYDGKKVEGASVRFFTTPIPPPQVETREANFNIQPGKFETILKGNLIDLGGYTQVQGYFRYRKKGEENWLETSKINLTDTGYFTLTLTNLSLTTTYQFEALIGYDGKIAYGGISEFTTPTGDVIVETRDAQVVGNSATLKGEITTLGVYPEAWVYFRYQKVNAGVWYETTKAKVTSPSMFSATLENLESNTTYQFFALADYNGKIATGYILQFTTEKNPVKVKTLDASNITVETATLNGELTSLGDYSEANVYFKWRKSGESSWQETQKVKRTTIGQFNASLSGLEINTTYEFKALANYDGKITEGELKTFSTPREGAKVETISATNIEVDSALLKGRISYLYGYPSVRAFFQYREKGQQNWLETPSQTLYTTEAFDQPISNLKENTQYEFRAVATYNGKTVYGSVLSFTTLTSVKIETQPASNISHFAATLNGNIISLGSFPQVDVYFQYRRLGTTTWTSTQKITKNTTGSFSSQISNLSSNTTYEFRAMADYKNPNTQRSYQAQGNILTFTTPKVPVSVETLQLDVNDYTGDTARLRGRLSSLGDYPSAKVFFRYRQPGTPWYETQKLTLTSPTNFYADISQLSPNTQTEYQVLAQYDTNIASGNILTFTTDPPEFRVETDPATNVNYISRTATLNGRVTSLGTAHQGQVYFKYKKENETTWQETSKLTLSQKQPFSINVSGLSGGRYQFKAVAVFGTGQIWEGQTLSFEVFYINNTRYGREITINSSQSLSNYQIGFTLNTAELISQGKMRSDCADIRVSESDMVTKLNYWLESCNTASTKIWVKVPSIPAGTKKIYVFYGNPSLSSESNGAATFEAFQTTGDLDTYITSYYYPNQNYCNSSVLSVGGWGDSYWGLISIPKSLVPSYITSSNINSATLYLYGYYANHSNYYIYQNVRLYYVTNSWTPCGVTWNTRPSTGSRFYTSQYVYLNPKTTLPAQWYTFDVTAWARDTYYGLFGTNYGIYLLPYSTSGAWYYAYSQNNNPNWYLIITYNTNYKVIIEKSPNAFIMRTRKFFSPEPTITIGPEF